jgi:hypothetical protein
LEKGYSPLHIWLKSFRWNVQKCPYGTTSLLGTRLRPDTLTESIIIIKGNPFSSTYKDDIALVNAIIPNGFDLEKKVLSK